MAERRMFHTTVVESDAFLDLPLQTQALYFHLGMHADDDGFVNSPKQIARKIRVPSTKIQQLVDAGYLLEFDGVVVLRHWRVANTLRKDRMKPLQYPEFAAQLFIQTNGLYTFSGETGSKNLFEERSTIWQPSGNQMRPKVREDKISEDKISEDKISEGKVTAAAGVAAAADPDMNSQKGIIQLTPAQVRELVDRLGLDDFTDYVDRFARFIQDNNAKVKNHYTTILKWCQEDNKL
jgi:hypothetical protein